jgi:hypothetical protein
MGSVLRLCHPSSAMDPFFANLTLERIGNTHGCQSSDALAGLIAIQVDTRKLIASYVPGFILRWTITRCIPNACLSQLLYLY